MSTHLRASLRLTALLAALAGAGCAAELASERTAADDELFRFAESAYATSVDKACVELQGVCQTTGKCQAYQLFCGPNINWACLSKYFSCRDGASPAACRRFLDACQGMVIWPEAGTPKLDTGVAPKADLGAAKPDTGAAKPDTGAAKLDTGAPKADAKVVKPDIGAPKADAKVVKPDTSAPKPDTTVVKKDTGTPPASGAGTIVPLYSYPTASSWTQIVQAKQAHPSVPVVAIVNVSDGPGTAVESNFTSGIKKLVAAGIVVIGYVSTVYGTRPSSAVKTDIDRWKSFYPGQLTGIFFDEQNNATGGESYYKTVASYAKSLGFTFTVGNPGTDVPTSYLGVVDAMFIYETDGLPSLSSLGGWHASYDKKNFGIIPYAVSSLSASFVASAKQTIGWIYITSDDLPNPWDTLPSYFTQLLAELAK